MSSRTYVRFDDGKIMPDPIYGSPSEGWLLDCRQGPMLLMAGSGWTAADANALLNRAGLEAAVLASAGEGVRAFPPTKVDAGYFAETTLFTVDLLAPLPAKWRLDLVVCQPRPMLVLLSA